MPVRVFERRTQKILSQFLLRSFFFAVLFFWLRTNPMLLKGTTFRSYVNYCKQVRLYRLRKKSLLGRSGLLQAAETVAVG
jgi:hypothetical protein